MVLFEGINRTQMLHKLIMQESTGTPGQLARRFCLSKRQLYNLLEEFREFGAEIGYSRIRRTFYYQNDFRIEIAFKVSIITEEEEKIIFAGENMYRAILLHGRMVSLPM